MTEKMFDVGKIINTHGIRGEVRVKRLTDSEDRFNVGNILYLVQDNKQPIKLIIAAHRIHKQHDLLRFEGYDNINDVEIFKNAYLKITEDQLTDLSEGEYYVHEIIGCEVHTNDGEHLGIVKDIFPTGANDVWVIQQENGKEFLIPFIKDIVKEIDLEEKKINIELMEGLLD